MFIFTHRSRFRLKKMCDALQVSRSGYYAWCKRGSSARELENEFLLEAIKQSHKQSRELYGSPRITADLKSQNIRCSKNRIARIMRANNIRSKIKKKYKVTTDSRHRYPIAQNFIRRQFTAERPNQVWLSDITYIKVHSVWMYFVAILDLYSRKIIAWRLSRSLTNEFVLNAIKKAVSMRQPPPGLIFHSDRGSQYASIEVRQYLLEHCIIQSMSRKGDCYDNAVMESFFDTLKSEFCAFQKFSHGYDTVLKFFDYIDLFYNNKRLHSSIGYMSPVLFEERYHMKQGIQSVHFIG